MNFSSEMVQSNQNQLSADVKPDFVAESSAPVAIDQNPLAMVTKDETQNGQFSPAETIVEVSKRLQNELQTMGAKIKEHEGNIKLLKDQKRKLDESVCDKRVILGKYHTKPIKEDEDASRYYEEETIKEILQHEKSAGAILCQLNARYGMQASHLALTKDVLGTVATLGKVDDDNLSRLLSEYLGLDTMLAIVCRTYDGVKALETYDKEGLINKNSGVHGLAASIGKSLEGRYLVICLENLRPYVGDFVDLDTQRKLEILEPRLPNGERPPGFLGYAVNMIILDEPNFLWVTKNGHGLRETLFYNLFSRLQVYRTRAEMLRALPLISDGALSLDGGIIKSRGVISLGNRVDVNVRFPVISGPPSLPDLYHKTENEIKEIIWRQEKMLEDIQRERKLMDRAKANFEKKKHEFVKFLAESSSYAYQMQGSGQSSSQK